MIFCTATLLLLAGKNGFLGGGAVLWPITMMMKQGTRHGVR